MAGGEPRHKAVKVKGVVTGTHIHAQFFMGEDAEHLALMGNLIMRRDEWDAITNALTRGTERIEGRRPSMIQHLCVELVDEKLVSHMTTGHNCKGHDFFPGDDR